MIVVVDNQQVSGLQEEGLCSPEPISGCIRPIVPESWVLLDAMTGRRLRLLSYRPQSLKSLRSQQKQLYTEAGKILS